MGSLLADAGAILSAALSNDSWMLSEALRSQAAWLVGFFATLIGAVLVLFVYKIVPFIDRNLERSVMVWSYLIIAAIIFVEVFRRFVLSQQAPWSTTLPPFLFLIMTWFGCSYNVRLRTHLAFAEFRTAMPRFGQMMCLTLDAVLWFVFCWIIVVTSTRVVANSASNFQIMLGTDNVMQWWFLVTVPISFILLCARAVENYMDDIRKFRTGDPLITQSTIGGE
ncbi:MAG: TRAP transporter small permease subunit [Pseudomonadota bacterium]